MVANVRTKTCSENQGSENKFATEHTSNLTGRRDSDAMELQRRPTHSAWHLAIRLQQVRLQILFHLWKTKYEQVRRGIWSWNTSVCIVAFLADFLKKLQLMRLYDITRWLKSFFKADREAVVCIAMSWWQNCEKSMHVRTDRAAERQNDLCAIYFKSRRLTYWSYLIMMVLTIRWIFLFLHDTLLSTVKKYYGFWRHI